MSPTTYTRRHTYRREFVRSFLILWLPLATLHVLQFATYTYLLVTGK